MADGDLVQLWIYDLSGGLARMYSQMLLGRQIEAIYHTSIVVGGLEHYFGGGISVVPAGSTPFGRPMQKVDLGRTELPEDIRAELLAELSERYTPQAYSLFSNNCNNFSSEFAQLLVGRDIPSHITALPSTVLNTPFGQMIAPMLSGLEQQMRSMRGQAFTPAAPAAPAQPTAAAGAASAAAAPLVPALPPAAAAAAGAPAAAQQQQQPVQPAGSEGPALHAAEVEIEAAVAAGMMHEADESMARLHLQQPPGAAAVPAVPAGEDAAKLAAELEIANEVRLLMAEGLTEHDAQAAAMEAAMARRGSQQGQGEQQEKKA
ncbi:hypothetical protein ABPG75_001721 [Micractinium tetrahymenae]